jgi:hypothetical protein
MIWFVPRSGRAAGRLKRNTFARSPQRPSMLDEVRDQIQAWLEREPTLSAVEILGRLKTADAAGFTDKHLPTIQRAVKVWRGQQARRIIAESGAVIVPSTPLAELAMAERCAETGHHREVATLGF